MCGIFCIVSASYKNTDCECKNVEENIKPLLCRRGPDYYGRRKFDILLQQEQNGKNVCQQECARISLQLSASVLHLRGKVIAKQPAEDDNGNILAWNGEIFSGVRVNEGESDTTVLLKNLSSASAMHGVDQILGTFSVIEGPWSFVYYQVQERCLWFGRDYFGRRSLLWHYPTSSSDFFALSSVGMRETLKDANYVWDEVPADGIYCLDLNKLGHYFLDAESQDFALTLTKYPWQHSITKVAYGPKCPVENIFNKELPTFCSQPSVSTSCLDDHKEPTQNKETSNISFIQSTELTAQNKGSVPNLSCVDTNRNSECIVGTEKHCLGYSATSTNDKDIAKTNHDLTLPKEYCGTDKCKELTSTCSSTLQHSTQLISTNCFANNLQKDGCDKVSVHLLPCRHRVDTTDNVCTTQSNEHFHELRQEAESVVGSKPTDRCSCCCQHTPQQASNLKETICSLSLNENDTSQRWVEQFAHILEGAVQKRVHNLPRNTEIGNSNNSCEGRNFTDEPCKNVQQDNRSKVGILFSGGLDSIVLAALANRCVPPEEPIDLINVAFEQNTNVSNPKPKNPKHKHRTGVPVKTFDVPDRLTGRNGVAELKALNPGRQWNFIEVNVTVDELRFARSQMITHLVFPQSTVLDDSIGCAIWFAAKGTGKLLCQQCIGLKNDQSMTCNHPLTYTSPAKVLLVGMGADEQLGGYARHRSRFNKEGWQGLMEEMEMEVQRISKRNLGRDDRCISDHGREGRYPYLDENVASFLNSLPVWNKCDPRLDRGVGEKILLRQVAKFIGLTSSSELPKRAIQFGSRIAKLEKSSEKGNEICQRF